MSALTDMHEAHVQRQQRLWFQSAPRKRIALIPPLPLDDVGQYGAPVGLLGRPSALTIRKLVALKHRVTVADLVGESRKRSLIAARDEAIRLVYTHCGPMSTPQLGRLFGSRDHSTVLHSLRKQGVQVASATAISFWSENPEAETTLRRMWLSGSTIRQIAAELGVSHNTVVGRMRRMRVAGRLPWGNGLIPSINSYSHPVA